MANSTLNQELERTVEEKKSISSKIPGAKFFDRDMLKDILTAFLFYIVIFIITEVIISGGHYQQDLYLGMMMIVLIVGGLIFINFRKPFLDLADSLKRGITYLVVFALLDFLLVNLMLEANSLDIYRWWATYVSYGILLLIPLILSQINVLLKSNR